MKSNETKEEAIDVIAFGAHPDDVESSVGGTLIKLKNLGYSTGIIDLSLGELGTNGTVTERQEESAIASKILGNSIRENLEFPNNFFENTRDNQDKIIRKIRQHRPKMVFIPYWIDRHPDHENAAKILRDALFTSGLRKYDTGQEHWRPERVYMYCLWQEFEPSFTVDISIEWNDKMKAMFAHKTQFGLNDNHDADMQHTIITSSETHKFIEARDRNYGFKIGKTFGEPFKCVQFGVGVEDPFTLLPNYF